MAYSAEKALPVAWLDENLLLHCRDRDSNLRPIAQHDHEDIILKWKLILKYPVLRKEAKKVRTKAEEPILLGNVDHSPNSKSQNHDNVRSTIRESCSKGYQNIVIIGDFNAPTIDWDS
ncbi:hypothetical protein LSH36_202g12010 [Paralvinella palmiformis]|uniref:Endonuclease/exonuclease/phosphatase domain-containing protein n=1 Tax=Paralvinella palmiformis TaxID=53620 RepID=A0AAD9JPC9_9ANNE|nr:hypothetical protein LSH36_202g12010 [Paralvinella palmiformis]